jgi:hypothetical protein
MYSFTGRANFHVTTLDDARRLLSERTEGARRGQAQDFKVEKFLNSAPL